MLETQGGLANRWLEVRAQYVLDHTPPFGIPLAEPDADQAAIFAITHEHKCVKCQCALFTFTGHEGNLVHNEFGGDAFCAVTAAAHACKCQR